MTDILRTNELENATDYLEKAVFHFNNREDNYWFKWLMISLHGALYGFGVCAIMGTNTERVLEMKLGKKKFEEKKKEMIEYYKELGFDINADTRILDSTVWYNLSSLLGIWDILDYCQDESYMMQRLDSKVLNITDTQRASIDRMINYRNDFAHFKPRALSVITEGADWIVKDVVDVIKFLALESRNVNYFEESNRDKVKYFFDKFVFNWN